MLSDREPCAHRMCVGADHVIHVLLQLRLTTRVFHRDYIERSVRNARMVVESKCNHIVATSDGTFSVSV